MNILVVHPEGNLNYNSNLVGLLELLGEAGHRLTYAAPRRPAINQEIDSAYVRVVLVDRHQARGQFLFPSVQSTDDGLSESDFAPWAGQDMVLAVDRGIIEGAWVARHFGIPHGLLSYEIFFRDEMAAELKAQEIEACRDLSFAICQDSLRSRKLCLENGIAPEKLLQIPVASRGFRSPVHKPRQLHTLFQLPEQTKVALYMGSLAEWTGASFLLDSARNWPEDWTLVVHERYGPSKATRELIEARGCADRVRLSRITFATASQMDSFIQSADLGVALYCPTYQNEWLGHNLAHIGLSSGKISGYLQQGVPVATHELGEISDWIRFYGAGQIFSLDEPFVPQVSSENTVDGCRNLFEGHLDLNRFGSRLMETVHKLSLSS
jgi:hypothetical protein